MADYSEGYYIDDEEIIENLSGRYPHPTAELALHLRGPDTPEKTRAVSRELKKLEQKRYVRKGRNGYYLTENGVRLQKKLESGGGPKRGLVEKIAAFLFLITGLVFMSLPDFTSTGNIISQSQSSPDIAFILSFILMAIGGILLIKSFKKKTSLALRRSLI